MFKIDKIRTSKEILFCIDMYYGMNDFEFIEADKKVCIKNFLKFYHGNGYFRCIKNEAEIIAWSCFIETNTLHYEFKHFQQLYYCCNKTGIVAARCVKLLHRDAIEHARQLGLQKVMSQGSHMDENNIFVKILEKDGWLRRGHTAVYKLPRSGPRLVAGETFFSR